jgi:hypothetical protein
LLMIGLYTVTSRAGAPVRLTAAGFGVCLAIAVAGLWLYRLRSRTAPQCGTL